MTFLPDTLSFEGCESVDEHFGEIYSNTKKPVGKTVKQNSTLQQTGNFLSHA